MKKKLVVALWSRNTGVSNQHEGLQDRVYSLQRAVTKAGEKVAARTANWSAKHLVEPHGIFVAPEYLFAEPVTTVGKRRRHSYTPDNGGQGRRHLSEADMQEVLRVLKEISADDGKNILMVPGTVAWEKPIANARQALALVEQAEARGLGMAGQSRSFEWDEVVGDWVPARAPINQVSNHWKRQRLNSLAKIDEDVNLYAIGKGITVQEAQRRRNNAMESRNTAYVLYNGEEVFVYNKQGDFHEVLDHDVSRQNIYIPGSNDGVFTKWGVKFGIEICLDHALGALKGHHGEGAPHIHIISSAAVSIEKANLSLRRGGLVLHACCHEEWSGIWRRSTVLGSIKNCTRKDDGDYCKFLGTDDVDGYPLDTYELTLDTWS